MTTKPLSDDELIRRLCTRRQTPDTLLAASRLTELKDALEPFARYCDLNDLRGRSDPDDAIEVPIRDCIAAHDAKRCKASK